MEATKDSGGSMYNKILCLSGGLDSVIAYYFLGKPQTIFFDTKTYSDKEKAVVLKIAPHTIIDNSLDFSEIDTNENAFIPGRNLLFAMRAAQYSDEVVIAGVKDDVVGDKNENAFYSISRTIRLILNNPDFKLTSPFWEVTKSDIVKSLLENETDAVNIINSTFSCYSPNMFGKECHACPACFRKWNALWDNNIKTPFTNKELMQEYYTKALDDGYIEERNKSIIKCVEEFRMKSPPEGAKRKHTFCFDIDGVLTNETEGHDYLSRTPNENTIWKIRELYNSGATIILQSARWHCDLNVTQSWLDKYSVPYHELHLGKPKADFYIDDRMIKIEDIG